MTTPNEPGAVHLNNLDTKILAKLHGTNQSLSSTAEGVSIGPTSDGADNALHRMSVLYEVGLANPKDKSIPLRVLP